MKPFTNLVATAVMIVSLSLTSQLAYAEGTHSHSHGHGTPEYDATDTEFGSYEPGMKESKTITVTMSDSMRFSPEVITVKQGEVVKFEHTNSGAVTHEFVVGTEESLAEHAVMMQKFPNMEHEEPYMTHVSAGESGSTLWKFDKPGEYGFACLVPGHYEAGMKGKIIVQ